MKKRFLPAFINPTILAAVFALLTMGCPPAVDNIPPVDTRSVIGHWESGFATFSINHDLSFVYRLANADGYGRPALVTGLLVSDARGPTISARETQRERFVLQNLAFMPSPNAEYWHDDVLLQGLRALNGKGLSLSSNESGLFFTPDCGSVEDFFRGDLFGSRSRAGRSVETLGFIEVNRDNTVFIEGKWYDENSSVIFEIEPIDTIGNPPMVFRLAKKNNGTVVFEGVLDGTYPALGSNQFRFFNGDSELTGSVITLDMAYPWMYVAFSSNNPSVEVAFETVQGTPFIRELELTAVKMPEGVNVARGFTGNIADVLPWPPEIFGRPATLTVPQYVEWSIRDLEEFQSYVTLAPDGAFTVAATVPDGTPFTLVATPTAVFESSTYGATTITVVYAPAVSVVVTPASVAVTPEARRESVFGFSQQFSNVTEPSPATSQAVEWSVAHVPTENSARRVQRLLSVHNGTLGVSIDESGMLTVAGDAMPGEWIVVATAANGTTGEARVRVLEAAPTDINVNSAARNAYRGTPTNLGNLFDAWVEPIDAPQELVWRINGNPLAGVELTDGMLTITRDAATAVNIRVHVLDFENVYEDVTVNLVFASPTAVIVSPSFSGLTRGNNVQFNARVEPYPTARQTGITWTRARVGASGTTGVSINASGALSASAGLFGLGAAPLNSTWEVRAATGGVSGTAIARVVDAIPTGLNVTSTRETVQRGTGAVNLTNLFGATLQPSNAPPLTWSFVNPPPTGVTLSGVNMTVGASVAPTTLTLRVRPGPVPYFADLERELTVNVVAGGPESVTINRAGLADSVERPGGRLPLTANVVANEGASDEIAWSVSPANAGIFDPVNGHETVFIAANEAALGDITITARAVIGGESDQVRATIVEASFVVDIRRGGINPNGAHLGAINHRGLAYSFDAIFPDAAHTLYFIPGLADARRIIAEGTGVLVQPRPADNPGFIGGVSSYNYEVVYDTRQQFMGDSWLINVRYTIDEGTPVFEVDGTYSVVVVARRAGHDDLVSGVVRIDRVPNNILTIPNIPANRPIRVATVMNASSMINMASDRSVRAVGYRLPGTSTFVFYSLTNDVYDPDRPYTESITRAIALASSERQPDSITSAGDDHYRYITATGRLLGQPNVDLVPVGNRMTFQWSRFERQ